MLNKFWFFIILIALGSFGVYAQTDYSNSWDDLYSYNNVKVLFKEGDRLIALTDNGVFTYDKTSGVIEKYSSVNGLSGQNTSTMYYDRTLDIIAIGYENGLLEFIKNDKTIVVKPEIVNFNIAGSKRINHITGTTDGKLFLSTDFGIVGFDLNLMQFNDTYFIGEGSTEVVVNETLIFNQKIYAATDQGIYYAAIDDPFLVDYQQWTHLPFQSLSNIEAFYNRIVCSSNNNIFLLNADDTFVQQLTASGTVRDLRAKNDLLTVTVLNGVTVYDKVFAQIFSYNAETNTDYLTELNTAITDGVTVLMGTKSLGVLKTQVTGVGEFTEIHPQGPLSNNPFSISIKKGQLWVVYGGYNEAYTPQLIKQGISHFDGSHWKNLYYRPGEVQIVDLVHVNIDPYHDNRVYVSSFRQGMLIVENDIVTEHWTNENSGLESLDPNSINIRIGSSTFDDEGNLWVVNAWVENRLKKYFNGNWTSYNLNDIMTNPAFGLNEIVIDQNGNKWIGSRRNGALVVNKDGSKMMSFISNATKGDLPDLNVRSLAVDKNNRVWIGTKAGLRVYDPSEDMFDLDNYQASVIAIAYSDDGNYGEALMGNQSINAICVDGANNKWFGTKNSGVLCTSPNGKETLFKFDTSNSPLPSNKILRIQFDELTGKVYFATDKGIVAFNSKIAPYAEHLQDAYAYPNPVKSNHEFVTIDGRNGNHLPYGTNVKILDASGALVYETNVKEGQENYGGKVVWNKRNLAGKKVASGVYIVLLSNDKGEETAITKIAIIN